MSTMWPWWELADEPEAGTYELVMFASVQLEKGGKETPIVILKSLRGYLNQAVPISELGMNNMVFQVETEDAKKDNPERVKEVVEATNT